MTVRTTSAASFALALAIGLPSTRGVPAQSQPVGTSNGEWPSYHGDNRNHHYSPLAQIDAANFNTLEVAWRFKTDNFGNRPEFKLEGTPLMVGGVVYTTAGTRRAVIALDAATGELRWVHGEPEGARGAAAPRQLSGRGVVLLDRRRRSERFSTSRPDSSSSRSTPGPACGSRRSARTARSI